MSEAKEFPPQKVKEVVIEVAKLLKERGETISVAETVCLIFFFCLLMFRVCGVWFGVGVGVGVTWLFGRFGRFGRKCRLCFVIWIVTSRSPGVN